MLGVSMYVKCIYRGGQISIDAALTKKQESARSGELSDDLSRLERWTMSPARGITLGGFSIKVML